MAKHLGIATAACPCLALSLTLLAGCAQVDPYTRQGMWQPTGANTLNLAAMIDRPSDLVRGRGTVGTPGVEAAPPISRYWAGKPAALPTTSSSAAGGQAPSAAPAAGAGAE